MNADDNDVLNCEEGRYPYPDACVFVVIGLLRKAATRDGYTAAVLRTYVAVSTQRRIVEHAFDRAYPEFRSMLTLSLDELRERVTALRAMRTQRRSGAVGLLLRVVQPFAEPYLVAHNDVLDHIALDAVYAPSVHDARRQVRQPIRAGMAVSLTHLEKTLAQMERIKTGDDAAPYHGDYSEAGDFDRSLEQWNREQPPEYHAWKERKLKELAPYLTIRPGEPSAAQHETGHDPSA
ncbi:hypothetical protein D769_23513 [Cupriavidus sp. HMR-1]|uniref:hypothetical protein n=1 Tax=Burkholderiaceae TaxID=119060 RepID=UPI0002A30729|nr:MULTISPECIES: hypothetical protein [Burkholderiaceae]EKZ96759.1 hypothetical protein D769_23513 [Cupriavidus sp. HMR-1]KVS16503.1 hypothetical protein WK32_27455 [Burkholderia vietnamiensis]